jgi:hypothetical protein
MSTECEVAWAAGLFEGEGIVTNWGYQRRLELATTDHDVLLRFQAVMGCGTVLGEKRKMAHYKPIWRWRLSGWLDVERSARALLPWLGSRRRAQVEDLLAHPARAWVRRS